MRQVNYEWRQWIVENLEKKCTPASLIEVMVANGFTKQAAAAELEDVLKKDCSERMYSPRIFVIPNFLSSQECDHLISVARPQVKPSTVVDDTKPNGEMFDTRRSSKGAHLYSSDAVIQTIERRAAQLAGLPVENGETIQVLQYQVGAQYAPHYDYFDAASPGGASHLKRGGQRVATVVMYLNTPEAGGETVFPSVGISITPTKGKGVLFYNCTPDGVVDPLTFHGGAPVKAGEKWIATRWIRAGKF